MAARAHPKRGRRLVPPGRSPSTICHSPLTINHQPSPITHSPKRGSVFILALWTLFFLGALALAVGALVSANINLASHLKADTTARELARAGIQRAAMEIVRNVTNWTGTADDSLGSNEGLFKDNSTIEGGTFSVTYSYFPEDGGQAVTNYGVLCEARKTSINRSSRRKIENTLHEKAGLDERQAEEIAEAIVACRTKTKKDDGLTGEPGSAYAGRSRGSYKCHDGKFKVLQELLLLQEFRGDPGLFAGVEPYLTVYGKQCFSGTAVGRALPPRQRWRVREESVLAESRLDFVVNSSGTVVYWHER